MFNFLLLSPLLLLLTGCSSGGSGGGGELISIASSAITVYANIGKFAGAVSSIKWKGIEIVNAFDFGRLWQTALQVDGYGECNNPTEAGSASDRTKSSSVLLSYNSDDRALATEVKAAYWSLAPNGAAFCPKGKSPEVNGQPSQTTIAKRVVVGALDNPNVIEWNVTVKSPTAKVNLGVEILTGYLPPEFDVAYSLEKKALRKIESWKSLGDPNDGYPDDGTLMATGYDQQAPIVFSRSDGSCAVGVWRPKKTIKKCEAAAYHLHRFIVGPASCSKFSVVSHASIKCNGNEPSYVVYAVVGTLDEVSKLLPKLSA